MASLTFNNISSNAYRLVMRSVNRQMLPSTKDKYLEIDGVDGSYLFPGTLQDRIIEVEFGFVFNTLEDVRAKARSISAWLRTSGRSNLIFSDEPDVFYSAKLANAIDLEQAMKWGKFKVQFRCLPYAYSIENAALMLDSEILLDSDILLSGDYSFAILGTSIGEVYNSGLSQYPQIEIIGSFTTFSITANGVTFGYSAALVSQTLEVNEDNNKTVKIGAVNKLANMTGNFIELLPGNNTVTISGTGLNCTVNIIFKNKYL